MKPSTKYWIGIKHVGLAADEPTTREMAWPEMIRLLMTTFSEVSLAKRIDVVVARTESECLDRLNMRGGTGVGSRSGNAESQQSIEDEMQKMLEELGLNEGDL